jgi:hypothetical protein
MWRRRALLAKEVVSPSSYPAANQMPHRRQHRCSLSRFFGHLTHLREAV